ncbi:tetratricopeptide repeat protein [Thalassotalea sp. M1531]|uniref:Tetratricopeptide repeat protein n=1 Tax=Thalassotalea algicola TaxID=2716224 RepID=A0A7Y0LF39_9GAMM|nr:tetratricopeptide repeat protein [Thalassotalea algicola]NMP32536.1 tetratricopeptide repeat protein [Thalassotalea algicola]
MVNIQQALNLGLQALNQGNLSLAEQNFNTVLNVIPDEPNTLFLYGALRQRQGRLSDAKTLMQKCLNKHPNKADVLNTLGNLMGKMSQPLNAVEYYLKAIETKNDFGLAYLNLGLTYSGLKENEKAAIALQKASQLLPSSAAAWSALGSAYKELALFNDSLAAYDKALAIDPNRVVTLNNKGTLLRVLQRPEEAKNCYKQALLVAKDVPELHFNMACASYDAGHYEDTDTCLHQTIALDPGYVEAHETLNKMYWEHGRTDEFTQSFHKAILEKPDSPELRVALANQLKLANRTEESLSVLSQALSDLGAIPQISHALGLLLGQTGNPELAVEHLSNAVIKSPDSERFRIDAANFLIRTYQYQEAMTHLDVVQQINPYEQEMWAFKGLCWRFTGDERESWLNNYDLFVQAKKLETPIGYDNFEHFIHDLKNALISMHNTVKTPLDQSVRHGTQTPGRLLYQPVKEIVAYRQVLEKRIREYLASLPDDPTHPFLSRKAQNFRFSGSWSVRLKSEGFHVNHVHPDGWFSGPTYIEVPKEIRADDPNKAGWVTFGETGMNLGEDREKIAVSVCPQEGLCAFFPSYVWHGTNPFTSDEHRMTTPCDVLPVIPFNR